MKTVQDKVTSKSPGNTLCGRSKEGRTWFPILVGVLCGLVACLILANVESPAFYHFTAWVFNEPSPKALFIKPAYYWLLRTILLAFAAVGGSIGVMFSQWQKGKSFLFLLVTLFVIALFAMA